MNSGTAKQSHEEALLLVHLLAFPAFLCMLQSSQQLLECAQRARLQRVRSELQRELFDRQLALQRELWLLHGTK